MSEPVVDIAIVGAGPTGLYAAYYAGFRGMSSAIVDALPVVGGQVTAMYPEKTIADVAGFAGVTGADLVQRLEEQARPFAPQLHLEQRAETVHTVLDDDGNDVGLVLKTDAGTSIRARTMLVAAGVGGFAPRPIPDETGLAPEDVDHFLHSTSEYDGRHAVVIGGGDSALDWALGLLPTAASVTVVHRRERFRAHAHSVSLAMESGVRMLTGARVVGSRYAPDLQALEIEHADGSRTVEPCGRVVAALGFSAQLGPILDWGLDLVHQRNVAVGTRMQTNGSRIFAAGDITTYDGKVPLISVGFGEAATAVSNACKLIHPEAPLFGGHSTEAGPTPAPVGAR
ncbi:NAD(P)/FAD-dependent oxidoreductase [Aeromicrobium sp. CTD01-1L150]|uniref:NAD(P)/FAD-dependent oxidoreductase n=1 Tax=Aeromicrobium sp. CTD01-1L150 TaxID=3341830 RepID=UPI0035BF8EBD